MKIATWNINSISVRLPHVLEWISANRPDALCLQEIKCKDEKFPAAAFTELGYKAEVFGQQTYNGVATLSLLSGSDTQKGFPGDAEDAQRRLLATTINGVRIVNVYIPNGSEVGSDKYQYKLGWLSQLRKFFDDHCDPQQPLVLCLENLELTRYLVGQAMLSTEERVAMLRRYCPSARADDWEVQVAGLRVQIIKSDGQGGGDLKFGTEVVTSADGTIAALLGASPGASTAVAIMLELLARCFPARWASPAWRATLATLVPGAA